MNMIDWECSCCKGDFFKFTNQLYGSASSVRCVTSSAFSYRSHIFLYTRSMQFVYVSMLNKSLAVRNRQTFARIFLRLQRTSCEQCYNHKCKITDERNLRKCVSRVIDLFYYSVDFTRNILPEKNYYSEAILMQGDYMYTCIHIIYNP